MRIGTSIVLMALGAILAWAVKVDDIGGVVSVQLIGYILMAAGLIGLLWSVLASQRGRVSETRTVHDPNTGEAITRSESHDGL